MQPPQQSGFFTVLLQKKKIYFFIYYTTKNIYPKYYTCTILIFSWVAVVQKSRSECTREYWIAEVVPPRPTGVWHLSPMSWNKREKREKRAWKSRERECQKGAAWVTCVTHAGGKQQGPQTSDTRHSYTHRDPCISDTCHLQGGCGGCPTATRWTSDACHSSDALRRLLPGLFLTVERKIILPLDTWRITIGLGDFLMTWRNVIGWKKIVLSVGFYENYEIAPGRWLFIRGGPGASSHSTF